MTQHMTFKPPMVSLQIFRSWESTLRNCGFHSTIASEWPLKKKTCPSHHSTSSKARYIFPLCPKKKNTQNPNTWKERLGEFYHHAGNITQHPQHCGPLLLLVGDMLSAWKAKSWPSDPTKGSKGVGTMIATSESSKKNWLWTVQDVKNVSYSSHWKKLYIPFS